MSPSQHDKDKIRAHVENQAGPREGRPPGEGDVRPR